MKGDNNLMLQDVLVKALVEDALLGQKIQTSDEVSEKGKFILDATEKNPNIEGSIAEDLASIKNIVTRIKATMDTVVSLPDGSVAEDGEIAAAKIGPDGEIYSTLQDAITQQIADYKGITVSNNEPLETSHVDIWLNTAENEGETVKIPEIDDSNISEVDTWSSAKINGLLSTLQTSVVDDEGNVVILANLIDDTTTAFDKVWSSNRVRTEVLAALTNISDGEGNTFNIFELIDDTTEAYNSLWSSIKIRSELNNIREEIDKLGDTEITKYIDDTIETTDKLWSSSKIRAELKAVLAQIPDGSGGGGTIDIFQYIDDTTTSTSKLWSSSKVNTELNNAKTTIKNELSTSIKEEVINEVNTTIKTEITEEINTTIKEEIVNEVKSDIDVDKLALKLKFADTTIATSDWEEDETYADFPYKAVLTCEGVNDQYVAQVIFNVEEVIAGIYAPVNKTGDGNITIWASEVPADDIIIPTIICFS